VRELFDLPRVIHVQPGFLPKADCILSDSAFFQDCTLSFKKENLRRALLTYVKPHLKQDAQEVCQTNAEADTDLVIHISGVDLNAKSGQHPQSRKPPCSYYPHLIATHNFQSVRLVVENGDHNVHCGRDIVSAYENSSSVVVRQTDHSLIDDACTLMSSQTVALGLATFAESLAMMSDRLKTVYVPALKFNEKGQSILYGSGNDQAGTLDCDGNYRSDCGDDVIEYVLYDTPSLEHRRDEADIAAFMLEGGGNYSQLQTCGHCV